MESDDLVEPTTPEVSLRATLAEADRLSTTAWTDAADMPSWMYALVGVWFASVLCCLRFIWSNAWFVIPLIGLLVLEGMALGWLSRRNGAQPNPFRMPPEFKRPVIGYFIGLFVVVGVSMVLIDRFPIVGFAFCAIASTIGMLTYRAHWYRAAAATRARVAT